MELGFTGKYYRSTFSLLDAYCYGVYLNRMEKINVLACASSTYQKRMLWIYQEFQWNLKQQRKRTKIKSNGKSQWNRIEKCSEKNQAFYIPSFESASQRNEIKNTPQIQNWPTVTLTITTSYNEEKTALFLLSLVELNKNHNDFYQIIFDFLCV